MRTVYVIFNPTSGSYRPERAAKILAKLQSAGLQPVELLPKSLADADRIVTDICNQQNKPVIIAVGGDGTVNTVINSMPADSATLGIIPLGTANVMARELGIQSIDDAVSRIVRGTTQRLAVGEAFTTTTSKKFVLMAGVGLDAAAVFDVRPAEKKRLGKGAYVLAGIRQMIHWDASEMEIKCGERILRCSSAIIANASHYAGPYQIAPQANLFSHQLVIVPLYFKHRRDVVCQSFPVLCGMPYSTHGTCMAEAGTAITISGKKFIQLDGDSFARTPVTIRLIPDFNDLIV